VGQELPIHKTQYDKAIDAAYWLGGTVDLAAKSVYLPARNLVFGFILLPRSLDLGQPLK
jgi:hypothetical protein